MTTTLAGHMRRSATLMLTIALVAGACGDDGASGTTSQGNTLETLPPTTTIAPIGQTTTTIDPVAAEFGSPTVDGAPLPQSGPSPDPAIGMTAPVAVGAGYDTNPVTIGGGGATQALLFVAHWCPHCQSELPEIVKWLDTTGGVDGVEFVLITVAVDPTRPNFPPSDWIAREAWEGPILLDDTENSVFFAYGGSAIPFWVFINADGTIATRVAGGIGADEVEAILSDMAIAP